MRLPRLAQVCLLLVTALLAALPLAGQGVDPTAATGFVVVPIDLAARTFGGLLPFDVPFQIKGQVPAGVDQIEVQYQLSDACSKRAARRGAEANASGVPLPCLGRSCPEATAGGDWLPAPALTWNASGLTEANAMFNVLVRPPLDANRCYRFRFSFDKKLTGAQAEEFRGAARDAIDTTLRPIERADLLVAQVEPLRRALIGHLKCAAEACNIRAQGRLFDPEQPAESVRVEWEATLARLLDPQVKRNRSLQSYRDGQLRLRNSLADVARNPALGALVAGLRAKARDDANERTSLERFESALVLVAPDDPETLSRAALCLDATQRPQLDQTWNPDDALACAASYRGTGERLRQIGQLVAEQLASGGVAPADRDSLTALTGAAGPLVAAGELTDALDGVAQDVARHLERRARLLDDAAGYANAVARDTLLLDASTTGGESTIRNNYVSADAGFVYAFTISAFVPYMGTNIYFRPVNKAAPLSQRGGLGRRFALTFGVTLASIEDKEPGDTAGRTRSNLFSNSSLVAGAGLRVTQSIRLGGGVLVFLRKDPNPLISNTRVGVAPYASFSFDLDVAKAFAGLGKIFSGG